MKLAVLLLISTFDGSARASTRKMSKASSIGVSVRVRSTVSLFLEMFLIGEFAVVPGAAEFKLADPRLRKAT
jgi:hypothetical protein